MTKPSSSTIDHRRSTCNLRVLADGRLYEAGRYVLMRSIAIKCSRVSKPRPMLLHRKNVLFQNEKFRNLTGIATKRNASYVLHSDPYPLPFPKEGHHVVFAILVFPCSSACDVLRILVGVIESPDPRRSHTNTNSRHFNIGNLHPCVWIASMLFWSRVAITGGLSGTGILLMGKEIE